MSLNAHAKGLKIKYGKSNDNQKPENRKKFIYVMIEPSHLIGMDFLDRLFKSVKD